MRVAVIGRSEILFESALMLHDKGCEIALVMTSGEAPEYTKTAKDFASLAGKLNAKFFHGNINSKEALRVLGSCGRIDIGISFNCANIISEEVISNFPLGILNAHGGDLPRYRGNACQAWAILNGEEKIGLCVHKMLPGELDSGDIIVREYFPLTVNTRIGECWEWMTERIPEMFSAAVKLLEEKPEYVLEKQSSEASRALRCYPRRPEDGRIDWAKSNVEILRLVNASSEPYSGAFCFYKEKKLIIWRAELFDDDENYCAVPGQIYAYRDDGALVISGAGKLKLTEVEYDSSRGNPKDFMKGIRERLV